MKKKNGFTLIEVLTVIIIIGIIMMVAVPAVSEYILRSDDASYASDVKAFIEDIKSAYQMKEYGELVKSDEVMIVPIENVEFEKGNSEESPYGKYIKSKSYIIIIPENNGYHFYANIVDESGTGVVMKQDNELNKEAVEKNITSKINNWESYIEASNVFNYKGKNYSMCELRDIETLEMTREDAILVLCQK